CGHGSGDRRHRGPLAAAHPGRPPRARRPERRRTHRSARTARPARRAQARGRPRAGGSRRVAQAGSRATVPSQRRAHRRTRPALDRRLRRPRIRWAAVSQDRAGRTTRMTDDRIYEAAVAAPPQEVWEAPTEPHTVRRYYYGTSPRTTWEVGSPVAFVDDAGDVQIEGVVLAFEPPERLAHTFIATWYGGRDDQGSLHWEVTPTDTGSRVTLIHRGAQAATREGSETADGSQHVIQALKPLLERDPDIAQSIVIDAPLERVWDAIA